MSISSQLVTATELLERYSDLRLDDANEADTRIKLIDRILYEILGWTHDDVTNEVTVQEDGNTTYADYVIKTANSWIVVEAKKVGVAFSISATTKRRLKLDRRFVTGTTGEAIKQARQYCRINAIPFAVVTNGYQWIMFPANRTDGVSFKNSYAIVFDSLDSVLGENFDDFTALLSREGVIAGNLEADLIGRSHDQIEDRRLGSFYTSFAKKQPNPIYPLIQTAVEYSFTDSVIDKDPDLLRKCYVTNGDRMKFDQKIKMHLQKKNSLFNQSPPRPMIKRSDESTLNESIERATSANRPLAILILGAVGAGKSTFLHYTRYVSAKEYFSERSGALYPQWIGVDFREFITDGSSKDFIYKNIRSYIDTEPLLGDFGRCIKPAYSDQVKSLLRGPYKLLAQDPIKRDELITKLIATDYDNIEPYVDMILKWVCKRVPVFLVIDNIDQFESQDIQAKIFSDCLALSTKLGCNIIASMRESTYVAHRHRSVFDAFDFDPIQIDPPEIKPVVSKRFLLASAMLRGKSGSFRSYNGAAFTVNDLSIFIDITQKSVLGTEVGEAIEVLAAGNIRYALRMTRDFMARGYTDPAKAIAVERAGQTYILPKHEAIRALLVGDRQNYSEEYSSVVNPFDSRLSKNSSQLLRLYVLSALVRMSSSSSFRSIDGYSIAQNLESIGFPKDDVLNVLCDLCKYSCVSTLSHSGATLTSGFFPTRLGGHIVKSLIGDLTFVENVMMDTFISDEDVWRNMRQLSDEIRSERESSKRLVVRVRRVGIFHDHMDNLYNVLLEESSKRVLPAEWCTNPFINAKAQLREHCEKAIRSSRRQSQSRRSNKRQLNA